MALLLSIETATSACSVALNQYGHELAYLEMEEEFSHSAKLVPLIQAVMKGADVDYEQLNGVIISKGPGSYTGLRIGTATAKAIAFTCQIPLIAVNSLEAMAFEAREKIKEEAYYCPMIDARRMEVYCLIQKYNGEFVENTTPKIIGMDTFVRYSDQPFYFFGNGASKCVDVLKQENLRFISGVKTNAGWLAKIGYDKFLSSKFEDLAYFEPTYLKGFRAKKSKKLI